MSFIRPTRECSLIYISVRHIASVMFALVPATAVAETPNSTNDMRNSWINTRFPVYKNSRMSDQFFLTVYDSYLAKAPNDFRLKSNVSTLNRRKEIRAMSKLGLDHFREVLNEMKNSPAVSGTFALSEYDLFVSQHEITRAPAAHFGCAFTLWHRIYLIGFERALQRHKPGLMLPYFDSRLDSRLPEPSHSVIWSDELIGTNRGHVTTGLGAGWKVYPSTCNIGKDEKLQRGVETDMGDMLYGNDMRQKYIETPKSFKNFTAPYDTSNFEMRHSTIHQYVGGQMGILTCSPNDATFWMHHCFVDYCLDELLRSPDFNKTYPVDSDVYGTPVPQAHRIGEPLLPFKGYRLTDVSEKQFMDVDYTYYRSPGDIRCTEDSQCNSEFLWCNPPQCVSKVRNGGFSGTSPIQS